MTQEHLAEMAGTSRATVNQVLREEERRGTVALSRGCTTVMDLEELAPLLAGDEHRQLPARSARRRRRGRSRAPSAGKPSRRRRTHTRPWTEPRDRLAIEHMPQLLAVERVGEAHPGPGPITCTLVAGDEQPAARNERVARSRLEASRRPARDVDEIDAGRFAAQAIVVEPATASLPSPRATAWRCQPLTTFASAAGRLTSR